MEGTVHLSSPRKEARRRMDCFHHFSLLFENPKEIHPLGLVAGMLLLHVLFVNLDTTPTYWDSFVGVIALKPNYLIVMTN